ncbi:MAG TPA: sugar ABC transporter permease [Polyangiaceae bacterium]|jgi:sn-glycerol 3-phosphate transport system permease protein
MNPTRPFHPYLMLLPTALLLAVFFFYPLFVAAKTSLTRWDLLTPASYVGLSHYAELVHSGELFELFGRTLVFSVIVVLGAGGAGLALAVALDRPGRFPAFCRSAVFSAYVVSWVSVALLWLWVLDAQAGVLNRTLAAAGLHPPDWLGDPRWALFALAGVTIWKITGYATVLFLAGLQDVPPSVLEAAALDGASPMARFRRITWPLLGPTTAFVTITSLILSFQVFDVVRVMTQGGPVRSTTLMVYAIYEEVFMNLRVGRASALVVAFFTALMLLTSLELWIFSKRRAL